MAAHTITVLIFNPDPKNVKSDIFLIPEGGDMVEN